MTEFSDLPEDVIVKIWSLLPVKSVLRLKSVRKSWYTLVKTLTKTPFFVKDHLYNSTNKSTSSSFILTSGSAYAIYLTAMFISVPGYYGKMTLLTLHHDGDVEVSEKPYNGIKSILGDLSFSTNCNSILCTVNRHCGAVKLLNPVTRELKLIPGPCPENLLWNTNVGYFGFGYDALSDSHKVVEIIFGQYAELTAKVCKLAKDKSSSGWRDVETSTTPMDFVSKAEGVFSEGFIYWLVLVKLYHTDGKAVLSFDLHEEKFEMLSLPTESRGSLEGLVPWRKSIAWYNSSTDKTSIGVWVMSSEKRWTKYLSIPTLDALAIMMEPKALLKNGEEILMSDRSYSKLVFYNVVENKYRLIYTNSTVDDPSDGGSLVSYVESFVAL